MIHGVSPFERIDRKISLLILIDGGLQNADERKVPVIILVIQTEADDKRGRNGEAGVPGFRSTLRPRGLVEQRADPDGRGLALTEHFADHLERAAGVDDILKDQNMTPFDIVIDIPLRNVSLPVDSVPPSKEVMHMKSSCTEC